LFLVFLTSSPAAALEWINLTPNPSYSRDIGLATSSAALGYSAQSENANPAGLALGPSAKRKGLVFMVHPAGIYQVSRYLDDEAAGRRTVEQLTEAGRLLVSAVGYHNSLISVAALLARPLGLAGDSGAFSRFEKSSSLSAHQNSLIAAVRINPRVSFGGRIDRYFHYSDPQGEGYSYGVQFRPKGLAVGVQYQRFPGSGARIWHPLDRRRDGTTSAAVAWKRGPVTATLQMLNLTQPEQLAYLEPHGGIETRISDWATLRAGGALYSRSPRWLWTAGCSLLDANLFRSRANQLPVPDEILQISVAVVYRHRTPELGILSLTTAWRF
jgi:hypothetical protein